MGRKEKKSAHVVTCVEQVQWQYQANKAKQMSFSVEKNTRSLFQELQNMFILITLVCVYSKGIFLFVCLCLFVFFSNPLAYCPQNHLKKKSLNIAVLVLLPQGNTVAFYRTWVDFNILFLFFFILLCKSSPEGPQPNTGRTALRVLSRLYVFQSCGRRDEQCCADRGVSFYTPIMKRLQTAAENNLISGWSIHPGLVPVLEQAAMVIFQATDMSQQPAGGKFIDHVHWWDKPMRIKKKYCLQSATLCAGSWQLSGAHWTERCRYNLRVSLRIGPSYLVWIEVEMVAEVEKQTNKQTKMVQQQRRSTRLTGGLMAPACWKCLVKRLKLIIIAIVIVCPSAAVAFGKSCIWIAQSAKVPKSKY